jgi:hypothetical protein
VAASWIHNNVDLIKQDGTFPFLNAAKREVAQLGQLRLEDVFPQHRFLVVRGKPDHPDAWLVNRLISDFVPFDFVSRYVFNKQGFYRDWDELPEMPRQDVVATLKSTYLEDKAAFRRAALRPGRLTALHWGKTADDGTDRQFLRPRLPVDRTRYRLCHRRDPMAVHVGGALVWAAWLDA